MKIALVTPYDFPYPGGVTEHTTALAHALQQRGHDIHILAACSGYKKSDFPNLHIIDRNVIPIPIGGTIARISLSPLIYFKIKRLLHKENFDVIHLQEPLTPGIGWWVLMQQAMLDNTVLVGTFHAYHDQQGWLYRQGRPLLKHLFSKLDALIAVSEAARQFSIKSFPGTYHIIPNGIDLARFGRSLPIKQHPNKKDITILFVGRLDERKGFSTLLEAFLQIKSAYPHLRLKVVGPFEANACQAYETLIQNRGFSRDVVDFVGYVSPKELPPVYHSADIFCAPSQGFESFGIVLLEAMAAGLPIVASNITGYRAIVTHNEEGYLVPPSHPEALAQALRNLLEDPGKRTLMGQQGQRKAAYYCWDNIIDQIYNLYEETIAAKQGINIPLVTHKVGQI